MQSAAELQPDSLIFPTSRPELRLVGGVSEQADILEPTPSDFIPPVLKLVPDVKLAPHLSIVTEPKVTESDTEPESVEPDVAEPEEKAEVDESEITVDEASTAQWSLRDSRRIRRKSRDLDFTKGGSPKIREGRCVRCTPPGLLRGDESKHGCRNCASHGSGSSKHK